MAYKPKPKVLVVNVLMLLQPLQPSAPDCIRILFLRSSGLPMIRPQDASNSAIKIIDNLYIMNPTAFIACSTFKKNIWIVMRQLHPTPADGKLGRD